MMTVSDFVCNIRCACVFCFIAIIVSFIQEEFNFNEADGVASPVLTLSKPSPCCLNLYVEVENVTAFGK